MKKSLRDRIREASSEAAIHQLLAEGVNYHQATEGTQKKWLKAAARRIEELRLDELNR